MKFWQAFVTAALTSILVKQDQIKGPWWLDLLAFMITGAVFYFAWRCAERFYDDRAA